MITERYSRFYPVCYTDTPDTQSFRQTPPVVENTFDVNKALLVNAGVASDGDASSICLTFNTPFLKESLCVDTCVRENVFGRVRRRIENAFSAMQSGCLAALSIDALNRLAT